MPYVDPIQGRKSILYIEMNEHIHTYTNLYIYILSYTYISKVYCHEYVSNKIDICIYRHAISTLFFF